MPWRCDGRRHQHDEGAGRAADLEAAAAERRDQEAADDGGVEAAIRRHAGRDRDRHRQRQRDDRDGQPGDGVGAEGIERRSPRADTVTSFGVNSSAKVGCRAWRDLRRAMLIDAACVQVAWRPCVLRLGLTRHAALCSPARRGLYLIHAPGVGLSGERRVRRRRFARRSPISSTPARSARRSP